MGAIASIFKKHQTQETPAVISGNAPNATVYAKGQDLKLNANHGKVLVVPGQDRPNTDLGQVSFQGSGNQIDIQNLQMYAAQQPYRVQAPTYAVLII